jgi:glycerophosphoryl diester phosphodiesterase
VDVPPLYAHRLGRAYGPDSSLQALARTLSGPVDGLETDCCLTADGELVLLHDPLLSIGTTLDGWARERPSAQIRAARLLDAAGRPTDQRPLALDELLERVPAELPVQVEVKAIGDPALARATALALCERYRRHPARERFEVLSFWSGACELAAAHGFRARLILFAEYQPEALAFWASRRGVQGICIEHFLISPRLVETLRAAGLSVSTGTVNRAELLMRVAPLALDSVCTDHPLELRAETAAFVGSELPLAA